MKNQEKMNEEMHEAELKIKAQHVEVLKAQAIESLARANQADATTASIMKSM